MRWDEATLLGVRGLYSGRESTPKKLAVVESRWRVEASLSAVAKRNYPALSATATAQARSGRQKRCRKDKVPRTRCVHRADPFGFFRDTRISGQTSIIAHQPQPMDIGKNHVHISGKTVATFEPTRHKDENKRELLDSHPEYPPCPGVFGEKFQQNT